MLVVIIMNTGRNNCDLLFLSSLTVTCTNLVDFLLPILSECPCFLVRLKLSQVACA